MPGGGLLDSSTPRLLDSSTRASVARRFLRQVFLFFGRGRRGIAGSDTAVVRVGVVRIGVARFVAVLFRFDQLVGAGRDDVEVLQHVVGGETDFGEVDF